MAFRNSLALISLIAIISLSAQCNKPANSGGGNTINPPPSSAGEGEIWLTKADSSVLLKKQTARLDFTASNNGNASITIDSTQSFQTVDGFGYTLTGGSAMLINKMDAAARATLLRELFSNEETSIGISYLRLSIGASDLDPQPFSYNDLPDGETDIEQNKFSIAHDKENLIPVLKEILSINPNIKILGSPWSPPSWMKDNNTTKGGSLKPEYYDSYAKYFVKYIQAMKVEGITVDAITPQNEPLHPGNNPSLLMLAAQQRDFIKNSLGPAFRAVNISTKIIVYDHNLDRPDYAETILNDAEAAKFVDGSAFHLYAGDVNTMSTVHNAFPAKNLYFTEQWTGSKSAFSDDLKWHTKNVIIGTMRNWSRIALAWNLANDVTFGPHTDGGCTECKGALTISGSKVNRNVTYYTIAHASKFIPPGSRKIFSTDTDGIYNAAFITPSEKKVVILLNENNADKKINIAFNSKYAAVTVPSNSVVTAIW